MDVREGNQWVFEELQQLPEYMIEVITSTKFGDPASPDIPIWKPSPSGQFFTKSAWQMVRQPKICSHMLTEIWSRFLPFKMSFLMWRLIKNKLPFDDIIARFERLIVCRCDCCRISQRETLMHTFIFGDLARNTWRSFGGPLGIRWEDCLVINMLSKWWSIKDSNSVHQLMMKITPIVIC